MRKSQCPDEIVVKKPQSSEVDQNPENEDLGEWVEDEDGNFVKRGEDD